jgi:hypothetical protein
MSGRHHARPCVGPALGGLTPDEAVTLLNHAAGASKGGDGWTDTERTAASRIAATVDAHPLALEVVGAYIGDMGRDLAAVADELANAAQVLRLAPGDDDIHPIRTAFVRIYDALPPAIQNAFAGLAVFGTSEFGRASALAMIKAIGTAATDAEVERVLNPLIRRNLVAASVNVRMPPQTERERLRFHPLLMALAAEYFAQWPFDEQVEVRLELARHYAEYLGEPDEMVHTPLFRQEDMDAAAEALAADAGNMTRALQWVSDASSLTILDADERDRLIDVLCSGLQHYWRATGLYRKMWREDPWLQLWG